ncbi:4'-phosphopantetheinyl transferase family protein [Streptomyces chrestomyceticus]|uniref:4'-phosphopantetheinyl transferase family protein n=1 Tax=Streptomyces chrestomyceticus TaxID=68185 RepID=UPI0027DDA2CD|nr:4'-phosphopantetheinyl transferase superfamily protein [Streptomyces chrestomyceticus]
MPVIASLLPRTVRAAEVLAAPGLPDSVRGAGHEDPGAALHPEELAHLRHAVAKRRREFALTRACARRALHALGAPPAPVLPGPHGAPQWPAGIVGSMTHRQGYCAAALAHSTDLRSLGIDAEPDEPLSPAVLDTFALPKERDSLRPCPHHSGVHHDRLLFSAKESVYKAWFPLTHRPLRPQHLQIRLHCPSAQATASTDVPARTGTFHARVLPGPGHVPDAPALPHFFTGRWLADHGLILTAVAVPPSAHGCEEAGQDRTGGS